MVTNNPTAGILIASNGGSNNDRKEKTREEKEGSKQERKKAAGVGKRGEGVGGGEKREKLKNSLSRCAPTRARNSIVDLIH